jgi:uncharacterized membrane protein
MAVAPIPAPRTSRRTVASFDEYEAAERAVDSLSDQGFPVEQVSIVGTGLRYVEQIGKRVTTGTATVRGLGMGAVIGLFWGLLFSLFFTLDTGDFFGLLGYGILVGAAFGAIIGAIAHYSQGGRRDFDSASATRATRYEVQVDEGFADEAERLLARTPAR